MQMHSFLKVTSVTNRTASNGRKFQTVSFSPVKYFGTQQIISQEVRTRNIWDKVTLENGDVIKADGFFGQLSVGQLIEGEIMSFNTTPYTIGDNEVNTWTGVIFKGENGLKVANQQLKSKNAHVVENNTVNQLSSVFTQAAVQTSAVAISIPVDEMPF